MRRALSTAPEACTWRHVLPKTGSTTAKIQPSTTTHQGLLQRASYGALHSFGYQRLAWHLGDKEGLESSAVCWRVREGLR